MFTQKAVWKMGEGTLAFANMKREEFTSAWSVEKHFPPSLRYHLNDPDDVAAATYLKEQKLLRERLDQLLHFQAEKVSEFVARELSRSAHVIVAQLQPGLALDLSEDSPPGVGTTWLIFVSELAANESWRGYLNRCLLPSCGNYFLSKHGGRRGGFCCTKHQHKGNDLKITVREHGVRRG